MAAQYSASKPNIEGFKKGLLIRTRKLMKAGVKCYSGLYGSANTLEADHRSYNTLKVVSKTGKVVGGIMCLAAVAGTGGAALPIAGGIVKTVSSLAYKYVDVKAANLDKNMMAKIDRENPQLMEFRRGIYGLISYIQDNRGFITEELASAIGTDPNNCDLASLEEAVRAEAARDALTSGVIKFAGELALLRNMFYILKTIEDLGVLDSGHWFGRLSKLHKVNVVACTTLMALELVCDVYQLYCDFSHARNETCDMSIKIRELADEVKRYTDWVEGLVEYLEDNDGEGEADFVLQGRRLMDDMLRRRRGRTVAAS